MIISCIRFCRKFWNSLEWMHFSHGLDCGVIEWMCVDTPERSHALEVRMGLPCGSYWDLMLSFFVLYKSGEFKGNIFYLKNKSRDMVDFTNNFSSIVKIVLLWRKAKPHATSCAQGAQGAQIENEIYQAGVQIWKLRSERCQTFFCLRNLSILSWTNLLR